MDLIVFVLGSLSTWRLSRMVVKETGPLGMLARMRAYLAKNQRKPGGLFDLASCVSCSSIYIGAVVALWPSESILELVMYTLSFSAISVLIERYAANK